MSTKSFDQALARVLKHEGGFVNHPADPGGATMKGVTQAVYDGYRERANLRLQSVAKISDAELKAIYKRQYWDAIRGDELPAGLDYVMFDGAVHSGPSQAAKWLQRSLRVVAVDGDIGEATLGAVKAKADKGETSVLVSAVSARRLNFLMALKTWKTFGKGWTARVRDVEAAGRQWVYTGAPSGQPISLIAKATPKALVTDAAKVSTVAADSAIGAGLSFGGAATILREAKEALTPYAASSETLTHIVAGLIGLGAVLSIVGLGWTSFNRYRRAQQADALDLGAPA